MTQFIGGENVTFETINSGLKIDKCLQRQDISRTEARGQGHSDPKTKCDTPQSQEYTRTRYGIPFSNNTGYAPDMIFPELMTEVKVTVTQNSM